MGTEVTVLFPQRYSQVNENFLKSDHPAVARTKPRLSSPFPVANPAFGSSSPLGLPFPTEPYAQSSSPRQPRRDTGVQEVINSFNDYIIPIPDPRPEDVFTGVPSESPARYRTLVPHTARVLQMLKMQQHKQPETRCLDLNVYISLPVKTKVLLDIQKKVYSVRNVMTEQHLS